MTRIRRNHYGLLLFATILYPAWSSTETHKRIHLRQGRGKHRRIQKRIVGGELATKTAYPYFAFVNIAENTYLSSRCGAVLVWEDVLLTAAHCLRQQSIVTAVLNATQNPYLAGLSGFEQVRLVTSGIIHAGFVTDSSDALEHDIAALKLDQPAFQIAPIQINQDSAIPFDEQPSRVIGLGDTTGNDDLPEELIQADLVVNNNTYCEDLYQQLYEADIMLCAGGAEDGQRGACSGDSGGPLIIPGGPQTNDTLIGITSFGNRPCGNYPTAFTRISFHSNWIQSSICQLSQNPPDNCLELTMPSSSPTDGGSSASNDDDVEFLSGEVSAEVKPSTAAPMVVPTLPPSSSPLEMPDPPSYVAQECTKDGDVCSGHDECCSSKCRGGWCERISTYDKEPKKGAKLGQGMGGAGGL